MQISAFFVRLVTACRVIIALKSAICDAFITAKIELRNTAINIKLKSTSLVKPSQLDRSELSCLLVRLDSRDNYVIQNRKFLDMRKQD